MKLPYDPVRGNQLVPDKVAAPERQRTRSKLSDKPGSFTLCDMRGEKRTRAEEAARGS